MSEPGRAAAGRTFRRPAATCLDRHGPGPGHANCCCWTSRPRSSTWPIRSKCWRFWSGCTGEQRRTIVMVLHDINQAARYAQHMVALVAGRIAAAARRARCSTPERVWRTCSASRRKSCSIPHPRRRSASPCGRSSKTAAGLKELLINVRVGQAKRTHQKCERLMVGLASLTHPTVAFRKERRSNIMPISGRTETHLSRRLEYPRPRGQLRPQRGRRGVSPGRVVAGVARVPGKRLVGHGQAENPRRGDRAGGLRVPVRPDGPRVHGLGLFPRMLGEARRRAAELALDCSFVFGDAEEPPFPDAAFDAVSSRHLLFNLPRPGVAVRQWVRILKPGGKLILIGDEPGERPDGSLALRAPALGWSLGCTARLGASRLEAHRRLPQGGLAVSAVPACAGAIRAVMEAAGSRRFAPFRRTAFSPPGERSPPCREGRDGPPPGLSFSRESSRDGLDRLAQEARNEL